jgi:hypothetical protein
MKHKHLSAAAALTEKSIFSLIFMAPFYLVRCAYQGAICCALLFFSWGCPSSEMVFVFCEISS